MEIFIFSLWANNLQRLKCCDSNQCTDMRTFFQNYKTNFVMSYIENQLLFLKCAVLEKQSLEEEEGQITSLRNTFL